jgi:hypothetical protein
MVLTAHYTVLSANSFAVFSLVMPATLMTAFSLDLSSTLMTPFSPVLLAVILKACNTVGCHYPHSLFICSAFHCPHRPLYVQFCLLTTLLPFYCYACHPHDCFSQVLSATVMTVYSLVILRYHSGGSMKLNACILLLAHMVYL